MLNGILFLQVVHFGIYAQPIAFGFLATLGLLFLLVTGIDQPTPKRLVSLWILCGLLPWIRPTLLLSSLPFVALSFPSIWKQGRRVAFLGAAGFTLGLLGLLLLNYVRFGSPFEFGYTLSLSWGPDNFYQTRFNAPVSDENIFYAAKYFLGQLFFHGAVPSDIPRRLEIRYYVFGIWECILVAIALGMGIWGLRAGRMKPAWRVFFCWSSAVFFLNIVFYSRFHATVDRYFIDFLPSVSALIVSLAALAVSRLQNYKAALATGLAFGVFLLAFRAFVIYPPQLARLRERIANSVSWDITDKAVREQIARFNAFPSYLPPNTYQCPDSQDLDKVMPQNGTGWFMRNSCRVASAVQIFLPPSKCLVAEATYQDESFHRKLGI